MFIYSSFIFIFVPLQLVLSIPMWNSCTVKNNEDIHISKCQQLFPKLKWKISFACYSLVVHHARLVAPCHFHHSFSLKYADGFLPNLKDGNEDKWIFLYTMGEGKHLSFENAERALKKTTKSVKWNANANQYTIAKISACSRSQCLCCFFSMAFCTRPNSLLEMRKCTNNDKLLRNVHFGSVVCSDEK